MKIKGKKISGPNIVTIVLPRSDDVDDIVFKAQAVLNLDDFETLCPSPTAPKIRTKDGIFDDIEDEGYKQEITRYNELRMVFIILNSLRATEGLEWETVDYGRFDTWNNYKQELLASGISSVEINRIIAGVLEANALDESKIEAARNRFLAGQRLQVVT